MTSTYQVTMFCSCILGIGDTESPYPAHKAAHNGNMELLSMLILEGHCSINQQDTAGSTAAHKGQLVSSEPADLSLLTAAGSGHAHCLQWLIDHGADGKESTDAIFISFFLSQCLLRTILTRLLSRWPRSMLKPTV